MKANEIFAPVWQLPKTVELHVNWATKELYIFGPGKYGTLDYQSTVQLTTEQLDNFYRLGESLNDQTTDN